MVKSHFVTCQQKYPWHGAIGWRGVVGLRLWVFDPKFNDLPKTAYLLQSESEMTQYFEKGSSPFPNWHTQWQNGNVPWHKCLPQRVRWIFRIEIWKRVKLSRSREEKYSFDFFFLEDLLEESSWAVFYGVECPIFYYYFFL